jgi:hypothetical protein
MASFWSTLPSAGVARQHHSKNKKNKLMLSSKHQNIIFLPDHFSLLKATVVLARGGIHNFVGCIS